MDGTKVIYSVEQTILEAAKTVLRGPQSTTNDRMILQAITTGLDFCELVGDRAAVLCLPEPLEALIHEVEQLPELATTITTTR